MSILFLRLFNVLNNPTNTFTISEPQDQEISELYVVQDRRATDSEAP